MKKNKVESMKGSTGRDIPNQLIIDTEDGLYFQSYKSIIAFIPSDQDKRIVLDERFWDYSRTTGKYRNMFLCENKKATQQKIDAGIYILRDLN